MNLENVTRVDVIDYTGRIFSAYFDSEGGDAYLQDDGRTLKIFMNGSKEL